MTKAGPILDYGSSQRVDPWRAIRGLLIAAAIMCATISTFRLAWNSLGHADENGMRSDLQMIADVQTIHVAAFADEPGDKVMSASVRFGPGGTKFLGFHAPHSGDLRSGSRMSVQEIGSYLVLVYFRDESWSQGGLDFGRDSPLANVIPFKFRSVRELSAHYDEVEAYLKQEPSGTFTDTNGRICKYRVELRPR
jgi:hypothetical protein